MDSVNGNEINYTVLREIETVENTTEADGSNEKGGRPSGDKGSRPDMGSMPDGASMPEGFDPRSMGGNFPGGFGGSDSENFGNRRGGSGNGGQRNSSSTVLTYDGVSYGLTENTATALIPVGTDVITKLGTKTTFSRISAGDCLALVTEVIGGEEVIMAVYIVG